MKVGSLFRRTVVCLLIAGLTGCGGGGGSTGGIDTPVDTAPVGVTSGIAVDPYIKGAIFQEILADGTKSDNISSASDENGKFTFAQALTQGSTIEMVAPGLHNGELYAGALTRKVDASSGELVASPITTLLAAGKSEDELVEALGVPASSLKSNPMAAIDKGGELSDADLKLLKASILAHAAVQSPEKSVADAVVEVKTIVDQLTTAELKTSLTVLNAVVALRDFVLANPAALISDPVTAVQTVKAAYSNNSTGAVTIARTQTGLTATAKTEPVALPKAMDLFKQGMTSLQQGLEGAGSMLKVQDAAKKFKAAEVSMDSTTAQADKDAILFFSAFSQLAALADTTSGNASGLNRMGDLMDAFGVDKAGRDLFQMIELPQDCQPAYPGATWMRCENAPLPLTAPTTGAIQTFLSSKLAPQLQAVVASLGKVSSGFNYSWADPGDVTPTEIDYADVLVFKAVAQGLLGQINIQQAYNLNVDLVAEQATDRTAQAFLAAYPDLGKIVDAARLTTAKNFISAGLADMEKAIASIELEEVDQSDDLITFYSAAEIAVAKEDLAVAKKALNETVTFGDPGQQVQINAAKFFSPTGVGLRAMVPTITGDVPGLFPDPTLGGVLVSGFNLNADLDHDGSPDLLSGYTQFHTDWLKSGNWNGYFSVANAWFNVTLYVNGTSLINGNPGVWSVDSAGKIVLPGYGSLSLEWTDGHGAGTRGIGFTLTTTGGHTSYGNFWLFN